MDAFTKPSAEVAKVASLPSRNSSLVRTAAVILKLQYVFLFMGASPQTPGLAALDFCLLKDKWSASTAVAPGGPAERHPLILILLNEANVKIQTKKANKSNTRESPNPPSGKWRSAPSSRTRT